MRLEENTKHVRHYQFESGVNAEATPWTFLGENESDSYETLPSERNNEFRIAQLACSEMKDLVNLEVSEPSDMSMFSTETLNLKLGGKICKIVKQTIVKTFISLQF